MHGDMIREVEVGEMASTVIAWSMMQKLMEGEVLPPVPMPRFGAYNAHGVGYVLQWQRAPWPTLSMGVVKGDAPFLSVEEQRMLARCAVDYRGRIR